MIRKYNDDDTLILLNIWERASKIAHHFLTPEFHQVVKNTMRETYLPKSKTWVYEESNKILGFILMKENKIGGLFISPESQSKGIGTLLVSFVRQFHQELKVEVFLKNKIGVPFYRKFGFMATNEYLHKETNQIVMIMKYRHTLESKKIHFY